MLESSIVPWADDEKPRTLAARRGMKSTYTASHVLDGVPAQEPAHSCWCPALFFIELNDAGRQELLGHHAAQASTVGGLMAASQSQ